MEQPVLLVDMCRSVPVSMWFDLTDRLFENVEVTLWILTPLPRQRQQGSLWHHR
jgi:hypothetical protein